MCMHIYSTGASEVWKTQTNQIEVTDIKTTDKATMQKIRISSDAFKSPITREVNFIGEVHQGSSITKEVHAI